MKNKTLFCKMLLYVGIIFIIVMLILFILGRISREGYLSEISINLEDTLKLNNIDIKHTKELFSLGNELGYSLLTNYIFTNSNILKYSYNFRISYYSKIFRNSDIYGVYLNTNSFPDYVSDIQFNEKGTPFGILCGSKIIDQEKINNIRYFLKIKYSFLIITIILICLCFILFYNFIFIIIDFMKLFFNNKLLKNKYIYILIAFLCFLIMPNIIYKVFYDKFDHTNYENRNFAKKPEFDLKKLDNYPKLYETYFNDYIPFRNELVKIKNLLDLYIFKNFVYNKVILGKNNWLFDKDYKWHFDKNYSVGNYEEYYKRLEIIKENLISFQNESKRRNNNMKFVILICPDKYCIYSNYMPDYLSFMNKSITDVENKLVSYLNENTDIKVVYSRDELMKYKDKYQLYYKADTHWNYLAGYIAYQQFMKEIGMNYADISTLSITETNSSRTPKALANFISLPKINEFKYDVEYEFKTVDNRTNLHAPWVDIFTIESYIPENTNSLNLLCFRDSFIGEWDILDMILIIHPL